VSERPRVLIADDHAPTRSDIRRTLEEDGRFDVCAEASDAPSAVEAAIRGRPDVCVLDIRMPGSGIGAAWEITARLPSTKVVMLTVSRDDEHLFAALRAGAAGYLLKDVNPHRLPDEIQAVLDGESALPRNLVSRLMESFRDPGARRRKLVDDDLAGQLTSREWQVLELMRNGLSTAQLAERLTLSQATVRSHIAAILRKLRVPDREAAVRLFEER
jgi:DNA-binding NarL/FixJ family response regulator